MILISYHIHYAIFLALEFVYYCTSLAQLSQNSFSFSSRIKTSHDQDKISKSISSVKCVEMDPTLAQNICNSQREKRKSLKNHPSKSPFLECLALKR